ncbi:hypothetical protein MFLAVUS_010667 [Mucor flavus]|uniref:Uncharacterized protein n=1 Tax=Mucor flavus TaxID=439312 RepID=A0ABP9ZDE0_9FUNG
MNNNEKLHFDKGIMRLSAYDPLSNQYETRILALPELPLLESLESMFDHNGRVLRMTKSCNSKKTNHHHSSSILIQPRRCQSNPSLCKQIKQHNVARSIKSKKGLSNAFHAVATFIQKATSNNKKLQRQNNMICENWWMSSPPISSF